MKNNESNTVNGIIRMLQNLSAGEVIALVEKLGYGNLKYEGNCIKGSIEFVIANMAKVRFGKNQLS